MKRPKVLHVDENHPILIDGLEKLGFENIIEHETPLREIIKMINQYVFHSFLNTFVFFRVFCTSPLSSL